ncbi:SusC/RagA family TonB-linked outer membrane protein [Elizabethkingia miricola]|uniref:SusC/RagA family TonB-linked outer membrane protein n=1 Tax=Elizabethkingia bruuniana TaxID=1756149 RepID=UPI00099A8F0C|nr:SusC/RagA family TonB-linked outer membrane protein [Elizabethkingia bruuniana]OPC62579.1 hypothetical protein BAY13_07140 [Elizabethkingia bruuniana]RBI91722.1 SusC/RagA family TonB-linked outer membrane protein [Elizabethkingia miricola]
MMRKYTPVLFLFSFSIVHARYDDLKTIQTSNKTTDERISEAQNKLKKHLFHTSVQNTYTVHALSVPRLYRDTIVKPNKKTSDAKDIQEVTLVKSKNINDIDIRKIAGSITTIDMKKFEGRSEMDLMRMLQGAVPGLYIEYNGILGSRPKIEIRGTQSFSNQAKANEPLFILDGMIISSETFLTLNPMDFSTIKVLKDAAASALYGIKAANGVIEITSKKGYKGKPILSLNIKQGITTRGPRGVEMMNSAEKLELERRLKAPLMPGYINSEEYIRESYAHSPNLDALIQNGKRNLDSLKAINTDWFKELIRPNQFSSYNLSVRGGTDKNAYYYSLNYGNRGGKLPGNDINNITARANIDYIVIPKLSISMNTSAGISKTNTQNGTKEDPSALAYALNPYETRLSEKNGKKKDLISYPDYAFSDLMNQYMRRETSNRVSSSLIFNWKLLNDLTISGVTGADYVTNENKTVIPPEAASERQYSEDEKGSLTEEKATEFIYSSNIRATYAKKFGDHDITLGANIDYVLNRRKVVGINGYGIPSGMASVPVINQSLEGNRKTTAFGGNTKDIQLGFGAAFGYSYRNIYDLYASYKRDGSSLLPSDKRWNTAWSAGFGWRLKEYEFLKNSKFISDLKLRASMGITASMAGITIGDIVPTYKYNNLFYGSGRLLPSQQLSNRNLNPQQSHSYNAGLDIGILKRFTLTTNFYKILNKQALLDVEIAPSNGFTSYKKNIGVLENKGIEVMLSGDIIRGSNFQWNSAFTFSANFNKVKQLYGTDKIYQNGEALIPSYEVGQPLGMIYGLQSLGIYPLDGTYRYKAKDGRELTYRDKGLLTRADFINLGYSTPPYNGMFSNVITYKNLSLAFDLYYALKGVKQYSTSFVRDRSDIRYNAFKGQLEQMWFNEGDEGKIYPSANRPSGAAEMEKLFATTDSVYRSDFISLNNIQLTYTVDTNVIHELSKTLRSFSLSLQAENICTWYFVKNRNTINDIKQPVFTLSLNVSF